jgi:hypothetical protein
VASVRRRFRVRWNDGEFVEVRTNAWDMTKAADYQGDPVMGTFALMHAALVRTGNNPPPLEQWIDELDEFEDAEPGDEAAELVEGNPTSGDPSVPEPSP